MCGHMCKCRVTYLLMSSHIYKRVVTQVCKCVVTFINVAPHIYVTFTNVASYLQISSTNGAPYSGSQALSLELSLVWQSHTPSTTEIDCWDPGPWVPVLRSLGPRSLGPRVAGPVFIVSSPLYHLLHMGQVLVKLISTNVYPYKYKLHLYQPVLFREGKV